MVGSARCQAPVLAALCLLAAPADAIWSYGPESFNCKMRATAWEFGKKIMPRYDKFEALYYALGLNDDCTGYVPIPTFTEKDRRPAPPVFTTSDPTQYYVDAVKGSDANSGSIEHPFKTIQAGVDAARGVQATVNLRAGTHYLSRTVQIDERSSGLTVQNYAGEEVRVSGGAKLDLQWQPFKVSATQNMYSADVHATAEQIPQGIPGFQINGVRATRARYPNGNVELPERQEEAGNPQGVQMIPGGSASWTPPDLSKQGTQHYVENDNPAQMRNFSIQNMFSKYMVGIGGPCDIYDPPVAYWCAEHPTGGLAFPFRVPQGVTPNKSVIAPAGSTDPNAGLHLPYKTVDGMVVNVWRPARWANWMFEMGSGHYNVSTHNFTFGRGGFQGARGNNEGGDFFVENVFEEFDYPGEFFFDTHAKKVYLYHNASNNAPPPADGEYVAPQLATLFNVTSTSRWNPVRGVTLRGVELTASRYTYMDPHGVPSGGDWALERMGAVFIENAEDVVLDSNFFTRLDGNGVMVSAYNRRVNLTNNEFAWIGGTAMAAWGKTNETGTNPLEGFDGTDGNHPRHTLLKNNLAREVGHYEKQSCFWFQGKTSETTLIDNVFFNGPRSGINFNDGLGGGDFLSGNLVFSTCRESGDHGPFNSWDRQPFLSSVRTGEPSVQMQWRELKHNFFIDNYHLQEGVDNDDGSAYYHTHDNVFVSGTVGMKNDWGGHDNLHYDNVYGYVYKGFGICSQLANHVDGFYNNTLVMAQSDIGEGEGCSGPGKTIVHNLAVYTPSGTAVECGHSPPQSPGTTVHKLPEDDFLIGLMKAKLGLK